ncbi:DUF6600 domain-containing protein [Aquabacter sp. CN5-332]|uniref:DUF6600 domain-containing protein n=1 Tax=Aquabacter sp. CN5-332 TaxID=3156608 RepID=UPI0032B4ECFC
MRASRPFAIAGLAASLVVVPFASPAFAQQAQPAMASAQQKVDINVFYEPLAEHGTWVEHPDYKYVWVPKGMDASWRPYQEGRWLWTDAGWYWESGEPFAWATYHYGRWGYDPDYGWFWVPGDTWAPAWVTWRRGGGQIGWAPIAPQGAGYAMGVPKRYDAPVAESWVVVRENDILAEDLALRAEPVSELSVWWDSGPQVYEPVYDNGIVVTRFIDGPEIARVTRTEVVTRQVVQVNRYDQEFIDSGGTRIGIYRPTITQITAASIPVPARVVRTVNADQRVTIRQYARDGFIGAGPSAALLGALGVEQRRDLRQARWRGDEQAYRRDIQQFQERERDAIARERQEAQRDQRAFEERRRDGIQQRMRRQQQALQQREQRAGEVMQRLNVQPTAAPAQAPNAAAPNAPAPNAATPGAPPPNASSAPGAAAPTPAPNAAQTPAAPTAPAGQPPNAQARTPQAAPNADNTGSTGRPDARTPPPPPQSAPPPQGAARETPAGQRQQPGAPPPPSEARRNQPGDDAPNRNQPPSNRDPKRDGRQDDAPSRADRPQQPQTPQAERTPDRTQQQRPNPGDRGPDQPRPAQAERPPQAPPQAQQPQRQQEPQRPASSEQRSAPQQPSQPSPRQSQSDGPRPGPQAAPPAAAQKPQGGGDRAGGSGGGGGPNGGGGGGGGDAPQQGR